MQSERNLSQNKTFFLHLIENGLCDFPSPSRHSLHHFLSAPQQEVMQSGDAFSRVQLKSGEDGDGFSPKPPCPPPDQELLTASTGEQRCFIIAAESRTEHTSLRNPSWFCQPVLCVLSLSPPVNRALFLWVGSDGARPV